jgi:hypothetical protein
LNVRDLVSQLHVVSEARFQERQEDIRVPVNRPPVFENYLLLLLLSSLLALLRSHLCITLPAVTLLLPVWNA